MERRELGRTGLEVGILSKMRQLLHRAHELGLTHFDTSPDYAGSECILGEALRGIARENYTVSTKAAFANDDHVLSPYEIERTVLASIERLRCGYLDVMLIAGSTAPYASVVVEQHLPVLERLRASAMVLTRGC